MWFSHARTYAGRPTDSAGISFDSWTVPGVPVFFGVDMYCMCGWVGGWVGAFSVIRGDDTVLIDLIYFIYIHPGR